MGLGLASAAGALALARALGGEKDSERDLVTRLSSDGSLAAQTAGLWRLSGGATAPPTEALAAVHPSTASPHAGVSLSLSLERESPPSSKSRVAKYVPSSKSLARRRAWVFFVSHTRSLGVGAQVAAWQFTAAVAEELYYRGLLQNGAGHGLGALGALPPARRQRYVSERGAPSSESSLVSRLVKDHSVTIYRTEFPNMLHLGGRSSARASRSFSPPRSSHARAAF